MFFFYNETGAQVQKGSGIRNVSRKAREDRKGKVQISELGVLSALGARNIRV